MGPFELLFGRGSNISKRLPTVMGCPYSESYIIIDLETTGLSPRKHEIVQFSAIKYDQSGNPLDSYDTYVKPQWPIQKTTISINGITNKMVSKAPTISEIKDKIISFLGENLIVGYNVNFDLNFLDSAIPGAFKNRRYVDVLPMARALLSMPNYKLETVSSCLGFSPTQSFHDSFCDCEAVAYILNHLDENLGNWLDTYFPFYKKETEISFVSIPASEFDYVDKGFEYWSRGEVYRKAGDLDQAIKLFKQAHDEGYDLPAIYRSYAMIYRKLKDYKKEIEVLDVAISKFVNAPQEEFKYRRSRAAALLSAQGQKAKEEAEKELLKAVKEEARKAKIQAALLKEKMPRGRPVFKCSESGAVLEKYDTITSAAEETGINSKSIREAATGKQKHAGGFRWKYVDDVSKLDTKGDMLYADKRA